MSGATAGSNSEFVFNGINGATGQYLEAPKTAQQIAALALSDAAFPANMRGADPNARHLRELKFRVTAGTVESFGTRFGVPPDSVAHAGWAVICPRGIDPQILEALRPLLDLRKQQ